MLNVKGEWSNEQINFLINNSYNISVAQLEKIIGKPHQTINKKIKELGLEKKKYGWTNEEKKYLIENYGKTKTRLMAEKLNKNILAINSMAILMNIQNKNRYWTKEENKILEKFYLTKSTKEIKDKYLTSRKEKDIIQHAMSLGLTSPETRKKTPNKNYYNEKFFSNINIDSAYWAGFIAADGYINRKNNYVEISLADKDYCILEAIKKQTEYNGEIEKIIRYGKKYIRIRFGASYQWIKDLTEIWNISSDNKSYNLLPPHINNKNYIYSYIIGLIDGDGCICYYLDKEYNNKKLSLSIAGTKEILEFVKINVKDIISNNPNINKHNKTRVYSLRFGINDSLKIIKEFNKIPLKFRLSRKWDKVDYSKKNPACYRID